MHLCKIAVTMGDPAGIGPEIIVKALLNSPVYENCLPVVVGDIAVINEIVRKFRINLKVVAISEYDISALEKDVRNIYVVDTGIIRDIKKLEVGEISKLGGRASYLYLKKGVELAKKGYVKAIVTAPINKESIKIYGIPEAGHTEILANLTGSDEIVTMFTVDKMKIFFHTRHISLKQAIETLNIDGVYRSIILSYRSMISIGYENPKLALAALNPHASDGGLFGDEEERVLEPACKRAREDGVVVAGPIPADSVFHQCLKGKYDAVVSLYHDQGHIAAKTYDFYKTVSVTLGLPFIRTSVDHGTAFDIAWEGKANPQSMVEAIIAGCRLSKIYKPML